MGALFLIFAIFATTSIVVNMWLAYMYASADPNTYSASKRQAFFGLYSFIALFSTLSMGWFFGVVFADRKKKNVVE
jgi:hypothetical protein